MTAIEEWGLSDERFDEMYDQYGGFNRRFNKNTPTRSNDETVYSFLQKGADSLVKDHADLIKELGRED